jgi:hypothetical protein
MRCKRAGETIKRPTANFYKNNRGQLQIFRCWESEKSGGQEAVQICSRVQRKCDHKQCMSFSRIKIWIAIR